METIKKFVMAALSSIGLFSFVEFLITRKDKKNEIKERLDRQERDNCRIQMLIMMNHYQEDVIEIMRLAQHYFCDLHGDWYMTSIFNKWLESNNLGKPEWFNPDN